MVSKTTHAICRDANPVIHPPISLLNGARFENEGADMFFYGQGVSPTVAKLIEKLDRERMALLEALAHRGRRSRCAGHQKPGLRRCLL